MFDIKPYQFLEWKADSFCCGDYVLMVLRDHLELLLPPVNLTGGPREAPKALENYPYRNQFRPIKSPQHLCVVELQRLKSPDHVGVVVQVGNELMITHCESGSGVLISSFQEIQENYKIVGFYEHCSNV